MTKPLISSSVADALAECYKNAGHWGSRREMLSIRDGPLEQLWGGGGGGIFVPRKFFSLSNSFMNFSFRPQHEYFFGLIGVHKFFSFNFPLCEYIYFLYFARPPPPIMFVSIHEKWHLAQQKLHLSYIKGNLHFNRKITLNHRK